MVESYKNKYTVNQLLWVSFARVLSYQGVKYLPLLCCEEVAAWVPGKTKRLKKKILSICFSSSKIVCIEAGENSKILAIYGDCREAIIQISCEEKLHLNLRKTKQLFNREKICTCLFSNTLTEGEIIRLSLPILNKLKISFFVILHLEGMVEQPAHDTVPLYTGNYVMKT